MAALLDLYPNLAAEVSQKYSVSIAGYEEGSTTLRLEGRSGSIQPAHKEIDQLVSNMFITEHEFQYPATLIPSLRKKIRGDNIQVYVCPSSSSTATCISKVLACSLSRGDHDRAVEVISNPPLHQNYVSFTTESCLSQIANHPEHNLPNLEERYSVSIQVSDENKLYVRGFVLTDVQTVRKLLAATVKYISVAKEPLPCSPEQACYLRLVLFQEPTEETNAFLSSLPLQREHISYSGNRIMLQGSPDAIMATKERILTGQLAGLLHRTFTYSCHYNTLIQIQQYVLDPFKESNPGFVYIVPQQKVRGKNPSSKRNERNFSVVVFSKDQAQFEEICQLLQPLKPQSKRFSVRPQALELVTKGQQLLEKDCRVRIQLLTKGSTAVVIHGLTEDEIEQCWGEVEDSINSKLVIVRHVPVDVCLTKYLQHKCASDIDAWKSECLEVYVPKGSETRREELGLSIRIRGTIKQVQSIEEKIAGIKEAFDVKTFVVTCRPKLFEMWRKRWKQVKKEQEEKYDLQVEFQRRYSVTATGDAQENEVQVQFTIFGPDREGIEAVENVINVEECDPHVLQKQIKLTEASRKALLIELKQKKLNISALCVWLDIDRVANVASLVAPEGASDDLDIAEAQINRIAIDRAFLTRQVTCQDPVVGLVLTSRSKSPQYLALANSIARPHNVSVRLLKKPRFGLMLNGNESALKVVEPVIRKSVIDEISKTIGERQLKVNQIYAPVFNSPEFARFEAKLQEDLSTVGSYPRSVKQSKVVKSTLIQPSSSAQCVKLEISKGSLIYDQVDAIVNAANEDLQHIGGLAKAILDAGGPSVQQESDDYVRMRGKVVPTRAVCLGPGKLPCKKIIHAVGPRWVDGRHSEEQSLYFTVFNTLTCASEQQLGSVVLPAISTGIFGVPEEVCARASMKAVRDFCQASPNSTLHTIRFALFRPSTLEVFLAALQSGFLAESVLREPSTAPVATGQMVPAHFDTCTWSWLEEHGSFLPYPPDVSRRLTLEYSQNPQGSVYISIRGNTYIVNFATMTQTNASSGNQRRVQRSSDSQLTAQVQWYYTDDKGQLSPYKPEDSKAIEAMWQSRIPQPLQIAGNSYMIDFNTMCQINVKSTYKRSIHRRENPPVTTSLLGQPGASMQPLLAPIIHPEEPAAVLLKELVVVLRGPMDTLQIAEAKLRERLESSIKSNSISLPQRVPPRLERKLKVIAKKNGVEIEVSLKSGGNRVTIKGLSSSVYHTTSAIQEEIINHQISSSESSDIEYPKEWQPGQQTTTQLYPVPSSSHEYVKVEQRFHLTMPGIAISQITRIQNVWLWEKYIHHKKMLHMKNAGKVNEKELFHGTRTNDPKNIYASEEGFDMRFSRQGMWGRANYFAENASYSHSYAHVAQDGRREMFLVRVLTGDSRYCQSDHALQLPPVKQSAATAGKVQFDRPRYDTVSGKTGGSNVYMTYDNTKAYPAYLIHYTG